MRFVDAGTETTGSVNFRCDMQLDPAKQHGKNTLAVVPPVQLLVYFGDSSDRSSFVIPVLVVDDIIDTGGTLAWC